MKKKMKAGLVVVVAIAAVMMLSSYAGALTEEEIKEMVLNTTSEVKTYKFDMNMTIDVLTGNETNVTELAMVVNGSGVVDNINKSRRMTRRMCMNMSEIMAENTSVDTNGNISEDSSLNMPGTICMGMEIYHINNTMYVKVDLGSILPFDLSPWIKSGMSEQNGTSQDQLGAQMVLLNCSNMTLLEDAEVKGVDCYVLKIVPDSEKFWKIMMNQSLMNHPLVGQFEMGKKLQNISVVANQSIMNISMSLWIAKDTKSVMKSVATMEMMTISPDTEEETRIAMDYEIGFYDYDVPVSIMLPPEAEGAIDIDEILGIDFNAIVGIDFNAILDMLLRANQPNP